ncbi:hypothetical protein W822_09290 [Advenella kashmirensis W13003]|uniref:HTH lysR-type domain-containing protein n=1 Tax=Advenella kashmirensis W13003 TaxID=1424334 RepID=V8QUM3_9BURK|nr:LysR family transcriptional regulator [Advenella kashmirensis]ETF03010.1 hypothetical protein W822_09290 [Advenella kashmirensis W13003]
MNFKLRQLEGFIAAADEHSFSSAAERLCMTQPAFSQLIRELETLLGARLFERTTRRVDLTEAGQLLYTQAKRPIEDLHHAYLAVTQLADGTRGVVRFAALPSVAFGLGARAVGRFRADFPDVQVLQIEDQDRLLADKVLNREVDFGIGMAGRTNAVLRFDHLFFDDLVVVVAQEHPLIHKKQAEWRDLTNEKLILLPSTSSVRRLVDAGLARLGAHREPAHEVVNMVTSLAMVRAGLGVTVLPRLALDALKMDGLAFRPFGESSPMRRIGILRRTDRDLSPAAQRFIEYVQHEASLGDALRPQVDALRKSLSLSPAT